MDAEKTLFVTNLSDYITTDILQDIFTQAGPVKRVFIKEDAVPRYALVEFCDAESVPYSTKLMNGLKLFDTPITVRPKANTEQERLYIEQQRLQRRHSAGPSRSSSSSNDYVPLYQPHRNRQLIDEINSAGPSQPSSSNNYVPEYRPDYDHRSISENFVNVPARLNRSSDDTQPITLPIPLRDAFATPVSHWPRSIFGNYGQQSRNGQLQQQQPPRTMIGAYQTYVRPNARQLYYIPPRKIRRTDSSGNDLDDTRR